MTSKVYVGNLGDNGDRDRIYKAFEVFGRIREVWVARNPPGFAFVQFEDPLDAEDAVDKMDGKRVCDKTVRVELSKGQVKRDRGGRKPFRSDRRYDDRRYSSRGYGDRGGRYSPPPRRRSRSPPPRGGRDRSPMGGGGHYRGGGYRSRSRSPPRQ